MGWRGPLDSMGADRNSDQMTRQELLMRMLKNQNGAGSVKVIIVLALLFVVIHVGYKLIPMYMDSERMKDEMNVKARLAQVLKDEEIRADLAKKAKELDLPLQEENFAIKRDESRHTMRISAMWEVEVHFLFNVYVRTFYFAPVAEEDYTKGRV